MSLGERVRAMRLAKGYGPTELASLAKVSRSALYLLETGKQARPRAKTTRRLAEGLGVPLAELLGIEPPLERIAS
jgi:transcriptional regulator with XRE-family HTH domain